MPKRFPPMNPRMPHMWHGGDYNPDQWLHRPDIIDEDFRLMKLAGCNTFSVGIFSWSAIEPREGEYTLDWLKDIMDRMAEQGNQVCLATPSGGKPHWMAKKYPEIRRVKPEGLREAQQGRHNHCYSSPIYRQKVREINTLLAKTFKDHPALALWHVSNEYIGECHCDLCFANFRLWLQERYETIDNLNQAWWTGFWSKRYYDWDEITFIDRSVDGMVVDWRRFVTYMTVDFMRAEMEPLREITPDIPCTTNLMGLYDETNFWKYTSAVDVIADDCYPQLHAGPRMWEEVQKTSMLHDIHRTMRAGQPWMMMESAPSSTNWQPMHKLWRPGVHRMQSLLAVGHGADAVMYFQWRKGRGGCEKFHGAVVDHEGTEKTRVFQDVAGVGEALSKLDDIVGTTTQADAAVIFDWENRWALRSVQGPNYLGMSDDKNYVEEAQLWHRPFWKRALACDVPDSECAFDGYKLLVAPMLFMLRDGAGQRLRNFVQDGGILVMSHLSAIVDDSNRCFLGGWPGDGLREVFGIWMEEFDNLYPDDVQEVVATEGNSLGFEGRFKVHQMAERVHAEGAEVIATFGHDFYAGNPVVTAHKFGNGLAIYVGARVEEAGIDAIVAAAAKAAGLKSVLPAEVPEGVTATQRTDGHSDYTFVFNAASESRSVEIGSGQTNVESGEALPDKVEMEPYTTLVLKR